MTARFLLPLLVLLALSPGVTAKAKGETLQTMRVDGEIEVDPSGHVVSHSIDTKVTKDIQAYLERAIADWRFVPPTEKGMPARARGKMSITLTAVPKDDGNSLVHVDNVVFPQSQTNGRVSLATRPSTQYPTFPVDAIVLVDFLISPAGETLDVQVGQCTLLAKARSANERYLCAKLAKNSLLGMRKMKFKFEDAPEKPVVWSLPLHYMHHDTNAFKGNLGRWRAEWRETYRTPAWVPDGTPRFGASDGMDGEFMQHAPGLRLLDGAIGRVL